MIWDAVRLGMRRRREGPSCEVGSEDAGAEIGVGANVDGIDKAAFVELMVKLHYLIICAPVRL